MDLDGEVGFFDQIENLDVLKVFELQLVFRC